MRNNFKENNTLGYVGSVTPIEFLVVGWKYGYGIKEMEVENMQIRSHQLEIVPETMRMENIRQKENKEGESAG